MNSTLLARIISIILLCSLSLTASVKLDIKGTILDAYNVPIKGAVVSFANQEGTDTTDENGVYHLVSQSSNNIATAKLVSIIDTPKLRLSTLHFGVESASNVSVSLYSLNGRLLKKVLNESVSRGNWAINPFGGLDLAHGFYLISITIDEKTSTLKCIHSEDSFKKGLYSLSSPGGVEKSSGVYSRESSSREGALDTLVVTVKGQTMTATPILEPVATLPPNYVIQRDIYGDLNENGLYDVENVYAVITQENSSRRQFAELFFNKASNSYSGFVYFMKSDSTINYTVETYVYAAKGLSALSSEVVPFTSNAGNIKMPTLYMSNSKWWLDIQIGDTLSNITVEFMDTAEIKLLFLEPKYILGDIIEYYWDNGVAPFNPHLEPIWDDTLTTGDPYKYLYKECGGYMIFGGFKTDCGLVAYRNQPLSVQSNNGAVTLLEPTQWPTTVTINDTITVKVAGIDSDVINSWECTSYKLSGNITDTIDVANLTTDTLIYQFTTGATDTLNSYVITLVDKNKGHTTTNWNCKVTNQSPSLLGVTAPQFVSPGLTYTIDIAKATDDGTIVKREYRNPPSVPNFTIVEPPYLLNFNSGDAGDTNSVDIRVTDEDGNTTMKTYKTVSKNSEATIKPITADSTSINDTVLFKVVGIDSDKIHYWTVKREDNSIDTIYRDSPNIEDTLAFTIVAPGVVSEQMFEISLVDVYGSSKMREMKFYTKNRKPYMGRVSAPPEVAPHTVYTIGLSPITDDGPDLKIEYRFLPTIPEFQTAEDSLSITVTSGELGALNKVDLRVTDNDGNISEKTLTTVSVDSSNREVILNVRQHDGTMKLVHLSNTVKTFTIPGTEYYGQTYLLDIEGLYAYIFPPCKDNSTKPEDKTTFRKPADGPSYPTELWDPEHKYSVPLKASDSVVVWSQRENWDKKDSIGYFEILSVK